MLERQINLGIIIWTTIIGGFFSSLVKWGSEVNMPPRMPGEISPPAAHIDAWLGWLGVNSHSLDYVYQGVKIPGAVTLYHWLFSFMFAFVYVFVSAFFPKIRLWHGALYGLTIAIVMHGFLIPLLGFRNPSYANGATGWLWNLNRYELWSEILGHIYWSVSIEVCLIAVLAHFSRPLKGAWVDVNRA
ncbi:YagU family protein [Mesorhizobium kowhaii]|uniref:YagU family protein n=2 Tax=Mesorhizobium TaxID=68287 RepID=A0ABW4WA47_9HYPH